MNKHPVKVVKAKSANSDMRARTRGSSQFSTDPLLANRKSASHYKHNASNHKA